QVCLQLARRSSRSAFASRRFLAAGLVMEIHHPLSTVICRTKNCTVNDRILSRGNHTSYHVRRKQARSSDSWLERGGKCDQEFRWCREGDLNPHGNPIRPASVRVCQARDPATLQA